MPIILSVKAGAHWGSVTRRDLKGVLDCEKAAMGPYLDAGNLPPNETKKRLRRVLSPRPGAEIPKVQLLTVALCGKRT